MGSPVAHPRRSGVWRGGAAALYAWAAIAAVVCFARGASVVQASDSTDPAQAQASQLSDRAFTLLNSVTAQSAKGAPMLAPVASLAADAQTLSTALSAGDRNAAGRAMGSIARDRDEVDAAMAKSAGTVNLSQWNAIKAQVAALEKSITPTVARTSGPAVRKDTGTPGADARAAATAAPPPSERIPPPPKITIASRVFKGGAVRMNGYLQGTDLKSAGIYDGEQKSKDIEVASVPGEQRINFDFTIEAPSSSQSIRVSDAYGREATAIVAPDASMVGSAKGREETIEVEPGATSSASVEGPIVSNSLARRNNTAEIPRPGDELSPSRRHMNQAPSLSPLTGVTISVIDAEELISAPGTVEVIGQIQGRGVKRAAVYVNGRMAAQIPISPSGYSGFDVRFPMPAGSDARIRAYGNGNDFVEASIDTTASGGMNGMTTYNNPPMYAAPYPAYPPYSPYPASPYYSANPYAYGANPYANAPYPNGYPAPQPYYGPPPYGYPPPRPAAQPWWGRIFK